MRGSGFLLTALLVTGMGAWTGCVHHPPKPLLAVDAAADFLSRNLRDEGLQAFVATNAPARANPWPPQAWDITTLTPVGLHYHPSLDLARADVAIAEAGIITAGARPNPQIGFSLGRTLNPGMAASPWLMAVNNFNFPIETAGKRGLRIVQARHLTEATRLSVAGAAWQVRSNVRSAMLGLHFAKLEVELSQRESGLRDQALRLLERRLAVGEVARVEVETVRVEAARALVSVKAAQRSVQQNRVAVARAVGMPPEAFAGAEFAWENDASLPGAELLAEPKVQTAGLLNRIDIRQALMNYAASEAALQLEVARQYPDIKIRPGYSFDQGDQQFKLGVSASLPVFNRNEGPIAEAEGCRRKSRADFLALQARVIGELRTAATNYLSAQATLAEIEGALTESQARRERLTDRAVELGSEDRLTLIQVRLGRIAIERAKLASLGRAQSALGALENAMQLPLWPESALPDVYIHTVDLTEKPR